MSDLRRRSHQKTNGASFKGDLRGFLMPADLVDASRHLSHACPGCWYYHNEAAHAAQWPDGFGLETFFWKLESQRKHIVPDSWDERLNLIVDICGHPVYWQVLKPSV